MDNLVKQRVVGAVVLVALAVIFIPIFLEGPDDEAGPRSLDIPQPLQEMHEGRIEDLEPLEVPPEPVTTVVIGEPGASAPEPSAAAPNAKVPSSGPTAAPEPQPVQEPALAPAPPATTAPATAPVTSGWVVQVGAFGQEANAIGLRDRLRKAGHSAFVERVSVDGAAVYRVRVGPYSERPEAEALLPALSRDAGLQGRVMSHP